MTLAEKIITRLTECDRLSDRELTEYIFGNDNKHQQVNEACRKLEKRGYIVREKGKRPIKNCLIVHKENIDKNKEMAESYQGKIHYQSRPVSVNCIDLPFHELSFDKFESFCLDLGNACYGPFQIVEKYGRQGQKQHGIDLSFQNHDIKDVWQIKNYKNFTVKDVEKAVQKFLEGKFANCVNIFTLSVACNIEDVKTSDVISHYTEELGKKNIEFRVYGNNDLTNMLLKCPIIFNKYFSYHWSEAYGVPTMTGWQEYGNWSNSGKEISTFYFDDNSKVDIDTKEYGIQEGINNIRVRLGKNGSILRLAGKSGTGKTKFIQTLFDERIGENQLDKHKVYYTGLDGVVKPSPQELAKELLLTEMPYILVIDNCRPEIHRQVAEIVASENSKLRLITAEHDVKERDVEEQELKTSVAILKSVSDKVVQDILMERFTHLDIKSSSHIAAMCDGNTRLAITVGSGVSSEINIISLSNQELFERIFWQGARKEEGLLKAAEVCALVYSFSIEETSNTKNELECLANILEISVNKLYRYTQILRKKNILQTRNIWRSIQPEILANFLAERAFYYNLPQIIVDSIDQERYPALFSSFCARIGYMHNNEYAVDIANKILCDEVFVEKLYCADLFSVTNFCNIAPASINKAWEIIRDDIFSPDRITESFTTYSQETSGNPLRMILELICNIAYEKTYFCECMFLLIKMYEIAQDRIGEEIREQNVFPFFRIHISNTLASMEEYIAILNKLIEAETDKCKELFYSILKKMLSTDGHYFLNNAGFGSHHRNTGNNASTEMEMKRWFEQIFEYITLIAERRPDYIKGLHEIINNNFNVLWYYDYLHDLTEQCIFTLSEIEYYPGYIRSIGQLIQNLERKKKDAEKIRKLKKLRDKFLPRSDSQRVELIMTTPADLLIRLELLGNTEAKYEKRIVEEGKNIGNSLELLEIALEKGIPSWYEHLFSIGQGIALGCQDQALMLNKFESVIKIKKPDNTGISLWLGFMKSLFEKQLFDKEFFLERILQDSQLGHYYPILVAVLEPEKKIDRLIESLSCDVPDAEDYWGINVEYEYWTFEQVDLFLSELCKKVNSAKIILKILFRIFKNNNSISDDQKEMACKLILSLRYDELGYDNNDVFDYMLSNILEQISLDESEDICFWNAFKKIAGYYLAVNRHLNAGYLPYIVNRYCNKILDIMFFKCCDIREYSYSDIFTYILKAMDETKIIGWCDSKNNSSNLYTEISRYINPCEKSSLTLSESAKIILRKASKPVIVLDNFYNSLMDISVFSGDLYKGYQARVPFLQEIVDGDYSKEIRNSASKYCDELIRKAKQRKKYDEEENERFERNMNRFRY